MLESRETREEKRRFRVSTAFAPGGVLLVFGLLAAAPSDDPVRILTAGVLAAGLVAALEAWERGRVQRAREATSEALHRTAAGDLTLTRRELDRSGDPALSEALHGLLVEMERILASFVRIAFAVSSVARDLTARSRDLSHAASVQTHRAEETAGATRKADDALRSLRGSMEDLSSVAENAGASLHEMSASIQQVSLSAQGLRSFVDETAQALTGMLSSLAEVASSVENLSRLANETATATATIREATLETDRQTRTAARVSERASGAAELGKRSVSGTAAGMTAIRDAVASASEAAHSLGERSARIGEILYAIEEVAGETNLLALNASIIAAQSGEAGRSFAVVAGDIRDLSDRTSASSEEVRGLIVAVRAGVDDVRRLLAEVRRRTEEGVELARTADGTLDDILRLSGDARKASEEIASATARQTLEIAHVSEASSRVSEEVERISRATRRQLEAARGVETRAVRVRESTEQLSRAMSEQAQGSQALLSSMGQVTATVEQIAEATATLAEGSSSVVRAMDGIRKATGETAYAATAMSQTAQGLAQESVMLEERTAYFRLPARVPGGRVRAALRYLNFEDYDPAFATTVPHAILAKTWGEGLVRFAEGTRIVPELAERWEVDPSGTLFTFKLRRGVLFHEGGGLTAHDVKASFERFLSPALAAPLATMFDAILGAPAFREGNASEVVGVEVPDPGTVRFRLTSPVPFFLSLLTLPDVTVVAPSMMNRKFARLAPQGTGPFALREIHFGRKAIFDRFPGHWDRASIALDGVDLDIAEDSEAGVLQRFLDGQLDVVWDVPYDEAARLMADPAFRPYIDSSVQLHTGFLALRCDKAPLTDVRVRRALNHAVDRTRLNEQLFAGLAVPAASFLPPHLLGHDAKLRPYRHDVSRARALLGEAGFPNGITLTLWQTPKDAQDPRNPASALVAHFAEAGITVKVEVLTGEEITARHRRGEHPHLQLTRWFADFPDPDSFFSSLVYSKTDDVAFMGYRNPVVDRLIEKGASETDARERELVYRELDRLIQTDAPAVFLFHNRGFVLAAPNLRGVRTFLLPPPVRFADLSWEK